MFENIKVIATDIDGTLAMKGGQLMPLTKKALEELHAKGIKIGLASGRPADERVFAMAQEWGLNFEFDFAIGMNGGELLDRETNVHEKYYLLPKEKILEILGFLSGYDINAIVYVDGYKEVRALVMNEFMIDSQKRNHSHVVIGGPEVLAEFDTGKIEVQLKEEDRDEILKVIEEHRDPSWSVVQTFRAGGTCALEFQDPRVNKGVGLEKYCEYHNIDLQDVLGFGDQENDIGLLKTAGYGVCLLNGADASKAVSQEVTENDVYHDGVGHWLYDNMLNQ